MTVKKEMPIKPGATWKEVPRGAIIPEGGTAEAFQTGDWRTLRPIHDREKCIDCMQCWAYCPDMSVVVEDGKVMGFDLEHCKGCGLCAEVCPDKVSAITMIPESDAVKEDAKKEEEAV